MSNYCFGVDIGGTTIKMGLFDLEGILLDKWEIKTVKDNHGASILTDVSQSIEQKLKEKNIKKEEIIGVGLDAPGPVTDDGVIHVCVNVGWGVFNLVKEFECMTGFRVKAGNDANVAALGEMWKGAGKGCDSLIMVTLGTGVGGGVVLKGKIVAGTNGAAGEIGHMFVVPEEKEYCNCGNKGCLEQAASATGIVRVAKRFLKKDSRPSSLREIEITAKSVLDCAKAGDRMAIEIVDKVCCYLGMSLANITCVVDTEIIVIGGGVSKAGSFLLEKIAYYYKQYAFHACQNVKFAIATLGNDAGIYGCAKLILDSLES